MILLLLLLKDLLNKVTNTAAFRVESEIGGLKTKKLQVNNPTNHKIRD